VNWEVYILFISQGVSRQLLNERILGKFGCYALCYRPCQDSKTLLTKAVDFFQNNTSELDDTTEKPSKRCLELP
jgi:hypothetical protein